MSANDSQRDPWLAALCELRTHDVSPVHAQRLRKRCHRQLGEQEVSSDRQRGPMAGMWMRIAGAVAGAWCVVYLVETVRRAAAGLGF